MVLRSISVPESSAGPVHTEKAHQSRTGTQDKCPRLWDRRDGGGAGQSVGVRIPEEGYKLGKLYRARIPDPMEERRAGSRVRG